MLKLSLEVDRSDLDLVPALVPSLAPQVQQLEGLVKKASFAGSVTVEKDGKEGEAQISLTVNDA